MADIGVNVGHNMYGDIHLHSPAAAAGPPQFRSKAVSPISMKSHAAVRSAMTALWVACQRAAAVLSYVDLLGSERRSDDLD
ncbi:hypothetical protein [Kitasatospora purpeofusca]|uniref:hypothetical protein n=1 Tax=Kitasatospora purpeofusca TaxID=67352 RepID=UPI0036D28A01